MLVLKSLRIVFVAGFLVSFCSGCSLTFAGLTAINEGRSENAARIPPDEIHEIAPGSTVRVHLTSGRSEEGNVVENLSLPERRAIRLKQEHEERVILLADVAMMERLRQGHSVWSAFLVGGLIDIGIVVAILMMEPQFGSSH
jgi:hypothetical protein